MQIKSLFLILIMLLTVPLAYVFSEDNMFFLIIGAIIFIRNLTKIIGIRFKVDIRNSEDEDEKESMFTELEGIAGIEKSKIMNGIKLFGKLILIIFHMYCFFHLDGAIWQSLVIINIGFVSYEIVKIFEKEEISEEKIDKNHVFLKTPIKYFQSSLVIFSIVAVFMNKFSNGAF
jgi:hypothetical protein